MLVKKFEAVSLEQALQLVKTELGPNALILSTAKKKGKWFQKPLIEVTAAFEKKAKSEEQGFDEDKLNEIFPNRKYQSVRSRKGEGEGEGFAKSIRKSKMNRYIDIAPNPESARPQKQNPSKYEEFFLKLGFSTESSHEFSRRLVFDYSRSDLAIPSFLDKAKMKMVAGGLKTLTLEDFSRKSAWVPLGVSGAGKTSLLVKLALSLKSMHHSVGLVSYDQRKVVGRSELATYAKLLKVPFSPEISREKTVPRIQFIDSPALSLTEENSDIDRITDGRNSFLVLDAGMRFKEMMRTVDRALRYSPEAIAFTRLDVISQPGIVYDVLKATKLPLLGFSLSQSFKVPFRFFSPNELAAFLIGRRGSND